MRSNENSQKLPSLVEEVVSALQSGEITLEMCPTRYGSLWAVMEEEVTLALKLHEAGQIFKHQVSQPNLDRIWAKIQVGLATPSPKPKPKSIPSPLTQSQTSSLRSLPVPFGWRQLIAQLVFDNHAKSVGGLATAAGLRSLSRPGPGGSFQQIYQADEGRIEVTLQVSYNSQTKLFTVIGQVEGIQAQARRAVLSPLPVGTVQQTELDETYTFRLSNVVRGDYALAIYCDLNLIEIPSITL